MLLNICRYPGVRGFESATYTCSIGITPSQVIINAFPPFDGLAANGDCEFSDGQTTIVIPDCARVSAHGQQAGTPSAIAIVLLDHRWRWQFGEISEQWNIPEQRTNTVPLVPKPFQQGQPPGTPKPDPPGTEPIKPETKKSARELAERCLKAMGERNYRVEALPSDAFPTVNWDAANPAQSLQTLADQFGCVVVWRNADQSVWICKRGEGEQLPGGGILSKSEQIDARPLPSTIRLLGARIRYQQRWPLEAVGRDFDGSIQPLWALSYRPDDSDWTKVSYYTFGNLGTTLPGERTREDAVAIAKGSVYRMYRIKKPDTGAYPELRVPPDSQEKTAVRKPEQIRPLSVLNQTTKDDLGRFVQAPARVLGIHTPKYGQPLGKVISEQWQTTTTETPVQVPFTIDPEQRLVVFADYVAKIKDGKYYPAEIVLECAAEVASGETNQYERYVRELKLIGGLDTEPALLVREDLVYEVTAEYALDNNRVTNVKTNLQEIDRKAQYLLLGEARRYELEGSQTTTWPGLRADVQLDGAIQQITYAIGGGSPNNPSTQASRNTEHNLYLPSYEGRRRLEATDLDARRRQAETLKRLGAEAGQSLGAEFTSL